MKEKIFVAGPRDFIGKEIQAKMLLETGFSPYVSHPEDPKWFDVDREWLNSCDALFRVQGESSEADAFVAQAEESGMPVFRNFDVLFNYYTREDRA